MTNKSQLPKNYLYYEEEGLTNLCAVLSLVTQSYLTLCNPTDCSPPGSSVYSNSSGKNTGVGCHALLQGIFPTQGLNPGLLHCRQTPYPTEPAGKTIEIETELTTNVLYLNHSKALPHPCASSNCLPQKHPKSRKELQV